MIDSFYIAATGMNAAQVNIDTIANNVSNINTSAFKRSRVTFEDLFYRRLAPVRSLTADQTGNQVGLGTVVGNTGTIFTAGNLVATQNQLDLAIQGAGFLQVRDANNNTFFTRLGALQLDADGQLQATNGYDLVAQIRVPANATQVTIGSDGTVSATVPDQTQPVALGQIELAGFVNTGGLTALGNGLYTPTDASGQAFFGAPGENGLGTLSQGNLESSNVDLNTELLSLELAQQSYQMNSRVVQISDEIMSTITNLRRT